MAEGARLESVLWVTPYGGSNPLLSAILLRSVPTHRSSLNPRLSLSYRVQSKAAEPRVESVFWAVL